ncbi:retrovirus-related pol polyprotein from transposon TNT 1-94 [Tanacetum coccineum]
MATMAENVIAAGSENRPLIGLVKLLPENTAKDKDGITDILLDIYTLINHYQTAKEIWDRVKELMEGTKMTKQERKSMLYDEFDKFTSEPGSAKKRVKDSEWFKDKMLLAQAQEVGVVLNDEKQDFLADSLEETDDCKDLQLQATANFKVDHVDAYDSDCDDEATANVIFMASLTPVGSINDDTVEPHYDSDILSEVPHYDTYHDTDVLNSSVQEMGYIKNIVSKNESYDELTIGNDADNYVPPPLQNNDMILSVIEQIKSQVEKSNTVNQETQSVNESLTSELERYKERVRTLENKSKNSASDSETFLDRELRTVICDRNRKKNDLSKSVTSHLTTNRIIEKCMKVLAPGRVSSTNVIESKPRSNTKNDRIQRTASRSKMNKVEAQPRKSKSSLNKNNHVLDCNANVKNITLSKNFENVCLSCNECLFSANHDACVVEYLKDIVEIVLWYLDFGCSKNMTGHRDKLISFVSKFIGLGHNLFSVRQFCDTDLEVAFRKHTCFNLEGVDLLSGSRGSNIYTISMEDMMKSSLICLLSKSSKTKSWLWHHRLSHLNFGTINQLVKQGLVKGLPKLKYTKDHLCSACQIGKSKKETHQHKHEPSTNEKLQMLHMDLCGPMRVESINKKRCILVIVDDYSCFTWVKFLRMKDEAPKIIIKFLKQAQVSLKATVRYLRTDNDTEFINQTLRNYTKEVGITHTTSTAHTP